MAFTSGGGGGGSTKPPPPKPKPAVGDRAWAGRTKPKPAVGDRAWEGRAKPKAAPPPGIGTGSKKWTSKTTTTHKYSAPAATAVAATAATTPVAEQAPTPQALPGGWWNFDVLENYRVVDSFDSDFQPESLDYLTGSPYSDQVPDGSVGPGTTPPNVSPPPPTAGGNLIFDLGLSNADLQKRIRLGVSPYDYTNAAWGGTGQPRFVLDRAVWDVVIDLPPKDGYDTYEVRIVEA